MDTDKKLSHELFPIIIMAGLFVVIHFLAILLVGPFNAAGMQAFEETDNPANLVYIFVILLAMTAAILLIAKFWKKQLIQVIILGAIGYTAFWVFRPLFQLAFSFEISLIISATFLPDFSIPPKIGPILGRPKTSHTDIPVT